GVVGEEQQEHRRHAREQKSKNIQRRSFFFGLLLSRRFVTEQGREQVVFGLLEPVAHTSQEVSHELHVGPPFLLDELLPFRQICMQVASDRVQARHRYLEQLLQNRRINRLRGILDELHCHGLVARQIISREPL